MWKNIVEPDSPQTTIWCMCIACQISKATDTQSEYVILIAFPRQQWLYECVSMLHLHANCLSYSCLFMFSVLCGFQTVLHNFISLLNYILMAAICRRSDTVDCHARTYLCILAICLWKCLSLSFQL